MKRILFAALTAAALFSGGILQSLNAQNMEIPKNVSPFPVGDKLPEQFSKYFIGQAWLAPLTDDKRLNAPVSNVTFSPGCRNNWHSHTGGQILVAVGGRGYYQAEGEPARELLPGDVVEIAPDAVHWHGAAQPQYVARTGGRRALFRCDRRGCRNRLHTRLCDRSRRRDCCDCRIFGRGRFRSNVHVFRSAHSCGNVHVLRSAHSCGNVHVRNSAPVLGQERGSAHARRGRRDPCAAVFRVRIVT